MKDFHVSISDEAFADFEAGRLREKMSMSSYLRYLIAEHEHTLPPVIKYKEIIALLSDINNNIHQILLSEKIDYSDKMALYLKFKTLQENINKKIK